MNRVAIAALRGVILLVGLGTLFLQLLLVPELGAALARGVLAEKDFAAPPPIVPALGITLGLLVELALVALWALLSMVRRDAIFSSRAFRWVDIILCAAAGATLLVVGVAVYWYVVIEPREDAPGVIAVLGAAVLGGIAFMLLGVVMRGLLRNATALRTELAAVV
jgi:hypothetical protein